MKKIILPVIFLLLSCSNNTPKENILIPKKEIQHIIDSFVHNNAHENYVVYELYIDKIDPNNSNIILYAGDVSLTKEENKQYDQQSLAYVISQGVKINVYSGVERYFINTLHKDENYTQNEGRKQGTLLAIKDSFGILNTYKIVAGYPFIPPPLENKDDTFTLPIVLK